MMDIDWIEIHRRVEQSQQSAKLGWAPSDEEKLRILKARAQALAQAPVKPPAAGMMVDVVAFLLADETYGIELPFVREVYPLKDFTPLPGTPAFVLGIVNVRGQILSIVDLKKFFELPDKGLTDLNKVIILQRGEMEIGILADAVLGVQTIPRDDIKKALPILSGVRETYLKGVTAERLIVLHGGNILADKNLVVNEQAEGWRKVL
ncbi:MAG: chemotaxis protein CheW [Methylococcaceae bacterium]|nr:chemotaxis protein CheW [Methylococcaceae bacterium]